MVDVLVLVDVVLVLLVVEVEDEVDVVVVLVEVEVEVVLVKSLPSCSLPNLLLTPPIVVLKLALRALSSSLSLFWKVVVRLCTPPEKSVISDCTSVLTVVFVVAITSSSHVDHHDLSLGY